MEYGECAYRDCDKLSKDKRFGKCWCPQHLTLVLLDGPLDPEPLLKGLSNAPDDEVLAMMRDNQ